MNQAPTVVARRRKVWFVVLLTFFLLSANRVTWGAGVTIVTHGLNGNVDDWVIPMVGKMTHYATLPGTNSSCYEIFFTNISGSYYITQQRIGGVAATNSDSGEIFIKLDWRQLANDSYSTYQVAPVVVSALLSTNFIPELGGRALAEFPIHLVGHSRGGSLVCEMSRLLGENGVWVDHLTTLDPHPLNNDGFSDFPYTEVDAPARVYRNVLFADNYWQDLNIITYGEPVFGAYNRKLLNLDGGYSTLTASHSDVHLWYHGTIDWATPTSDTQANLTQSERDAWWTYSEYYGILAGYYYSRIAGGDRFSSFEPAGTGTGASKDGVNQLWNFGAGSSANRYSLTNNTGAWPNPLRFFLTTTNRLAAGQNFSVRLYHQSGSVTNSTVSVQFYLDPDANPLNGNAILVSQGTASTTGTNIVANFTTALSTSLTNTPPGNYRVFVKMTYGGKTRYAYGDQIIAVTSPPSPILTLTSPFQHPVGLRVSSLQGLKVVLQSSTNLSSWNSVATNTLSTNFWDAVDSASSSASRKFYRAVVVP
jgi:hypothetical protein